MHNQKKNPAFFKIAARTKDLVLDKFGKMLYNVTNIIILHGDLPWKRKYSTV